MPFEQDYLPELDNILAPFDNVYAKLNDLNAAHKAPLSGNKTPEIMDAAIMCGPASYYQLIADSQPKVDRKAAGPMGDELRQHIHDPWRHKRKRGKRETFSVV